MSIILYQKCFQTQGRFLNSPISMNFKRKRDQWEREKLPKKEENNFLWENDEERYDIFKQGCSFSYDTWIVDSDTPYMKVAFKCSFNRMYYDGRILVRQQDIDLFQKQRLEVQKLKYAHKTDIKRRYEIFKDKMVNFYIRLYYSRMIINMKQSSFEME